MTVIVTRKSGANVPISFSGHNIELNIKGRYTTADPEIQELLESSEAFKSNYDLVATVEDKNNTKKASAQQDPPPGGNDLTKIEGKNTVQAAKLYLVETYKEDELPVPSSLTTWKAIDEAAVKLGIEFVR